MEKQNFPEKQAWGTWEELLLACAVHRYGTERWDSVSMELQKRSSTVYHHHLTPNNCRKKYHDLKRRFDQNDSVSHPYDDDDDNINNTDGSTTSPTIPWLDELRKLRVAELRREVERYDLSIVSLQLKVKKLTEEREESLRDDDKVTEKSDLEKFVEKDGEVEIKDMDVEPEKINGKSDFGEDSDRENRSYSESKSTDPKVEVPEAEDAERKAVPEEPVVETSEPDGDCTKPAGEDSCNGSSNTTAKESAAPAASPVRDSEKGNSERGGGDSAELWESVTESKGGEEGVKESNSDVQSSVSLSRKKRDEQSNEDQSPATKRTSAESQPLVHFLEILRSHRFGSVFERRLEAQETPKYTRLIRQHVDLETIRTRLEEGWYTGGNSKFFRDLLLLFNNAIVFFGKNSSESMAAIELRRLVSKEMAREIYKPNPPPKEQIKPDPEELPNSLLLKPKISVPLNVCRKRSSITSKALASSSGPDKKRDQKATFIDEKPVLDWNLPDKSSDESEEHRVTKKRTRERFKTFSRNLSKNGKNRSSNTNTNTTTNKNKNLDTNSNTGVSSKGVVSRNEISESKSDKEKKKTIANTGAKKKSAANFLNRMKRSSSSNNGSSILVEKSKSPDNGKKNSNSNGKGGSRKGQQPSRKSSGRNQVKEQESPTKKSVGRPPKRAAAPPPALPAKRGREAGETEPNGSRHSKKRSRK